MSDYTYPAADDLSDKDGLASGNAEKIILGSDLEAEFQAISTAIATKLDTSDRATQAQAQDETSNAVYMTPLRVANWADHNAGIVGNLQALTDPNADRLIFWDDSAGAAAFLSIGTGLSISGTTLSADDANIDHDSLSGFVSNEHVDHSSVSITAGAGLSGGGDLTASRSLALDINGLTTESTLDTANDYVAIYDGSAGAPRKTALSNLVSQSAIKAGRWTRSASQAISASTAATVVFNSEQFDTLAKGSFSTATGQYTASSAVKVLVTVGIAMNTIPEESSLSVDVQVNGTSVGGDYILCPPGVGSSIQRATVAVPLSLSSSDVVRVRVTPSADAMTIASGAATFIGIVELA